MNADDAKQKQLIEALADHELVKAAVIIDERGRVKSRRGKARALRTLSDPDDATMIVSTPQKPQLKESVYVARAGGDFLLVFFDENVSFDMIKQQADHLLGLLELTPA